MFTAIGAPPVLGFALPRSLVTPESFRFVLVSAAMAFHAVLIVVDTFFYVLLPDFGAGMFVAPVAGIAAVVAVNVTGLAFRGVGLIESEVLLVIERGR